MAEARLVPLIGPSVPLARHAAQAPAHLHKARKLGRDLRLAGHCGPDVAAKAAPDEHDAIAIRFQTSQLCELGQIREVCVDVAPALLQARQAHGRAINDAER